MRSFCASYLPRSFCAALLFITSIRTTLLLLYAPLRSFVPLTIPVALPLYCAPSFLRSFVSTLPHNYTRAPHIFHFLQFVILLEHLRSFSNCAPFQIALLFRRDHDMNSRYRRRDNATVRYRKGQQNAGDESLVAMRCLPDSKRFEDSNGAGKGSPAILVTRDCWDTDGDQNRIELPTETISVM